MADNTISVAWLIKKGSSKTYDCNDMPRHIWGFGLENLWLTAAHCPGVLNVEADEASREFSDESEWTMQQLFFNGIAQILGQPDIDLFAIEIELQD